MYNHGAALLYMKIWPRPSWHDFGDVGVLCTFSYTTSAASRIVRNSHLNSSLLGQTVQHDIAGSTAHPVQIIAPPPLCVYIVQSWTVRWKTFA